MEEETRAWIAEKGWGNGEVDLIEAVHRRRIQTARDRELVDRFERTARQLSPLAASAAGVAPRLDRDRKIAQAVLAGYADRMGKPQGNGVIVLSGGLGSSGGTARVKPEASLKSGQWWVVTQVFEGPSGGAKLGAKLPEASGLVAVDLEDALTLDPFP
jgi:hypothetical protein